MMTKLIELLKTKGADVTELEAYNEIIVKALSYNGDLQKAIEAGNEDEVKKIAEDAFKAAEAAILIVQNI